MGRVNAARQQRGTHMTAGLWFRKTDPFDTPEQRKIRDALFHGYKYGAIRTRVEHGQLIIEPIPITEMYKTQEDKADD